MKIDHACLIKTLVRCCFLESCLHVVALSSAANLASSGIQTDDIVCARARGLHVVCTQQQLLYVVCAWHACGPRFNLALQQRKLRVISVETVTMKPRC